MKFNQLALEICKREGKKQQVNIAQVSEILRCLEEIYYELGMDTVLKVSPTKKKTKKKAKKK